jgi:CHAD domain-containing protein
VRLGEDAEAVHQARVGTRRLRSDLRTFGPLIDAGWSEPLRAELKWLADLLGAVRDRDVLIERVLADIEQLGPDDAAHGAEITGALATQRDEARDALLRALKTKRYVQLLDRLVDAALDPRVLPEASRAATSSLPALAERTWRALAKAVKKAGDDPEDDVLHAIRIHAKRARYAADVAALVVGKPAARFAEAVAGVQEVLGEHQDACVRRAWLREIAPTLTPHAALVAGQLIASAQSAADGGRREWRKAWKQANEGRLREWLSR